MNQEFSDFSRKEKSTVKGRDKLHVKYKETFYARPKQLLNNHLKNTGSYAEKYSVKNKRLSKIAGSNHDIGKFLNDFQRSLRTGEKISHAPVGAEIMWHISKYLNLTPVEKFILTTSVWCHHVAPRNIGNNLWAINNKDKAESLIENIINHHKPLEPDLETVQKGLKDWLNYYTKDSSIPPLDEYHLNNIYNINKEDTSELFYNFLDVFGALVSADWKDASGIETEKINFEYNFLKNSLDEYIENLADKKKNEPLSQKRLKFYIDAVKKLYGKDHRIINIKLPTGMGKTFLGLRIALELASVSKLERIVYALPWVTVVDQVYSNYLDFLKSYISNNPSTLLGRTHHLADSIEDSYMINNSSIEDIPAEKIAHLISSWQTRVVCTTFNQIFNTILAVRNRYVWRLPQLANSILIIDEPQGLPPEWQKELGEILRNVAFMLNMRIIVMTATPPLQFWKGININGEAVEYPEKESKIKLNRTRLVYKSIPLSIEESTDIFIEYSSGNSSLFVCNTIDSAIQLYKNLKEKLSNYQEGWKLIKENDLIKPDKPIIFLLNGEIKPEYREMLINMIESVIINKIYVVSTQIMETGIDLDFDNAFRALGPLNSDIQIAGRCNRGGKWKDPRNVYIVKMVEKDENGNIMRVYGKGAPYDGNIIKKTEEILNNEGSIQENNYQEKLQEWMMNIEPNLQKDSILIGDDEYKNIGSAIQNLDLKALTSFSLIKDYSKYEVFILTKNSRSIWEDILKGKNNKDTAKHTIRAKEDFLYMFNYSPILSGGKEKSIPYIDCSECDNCNSCDENTINYCPWRGFLRNTPII